jgi:hypothetical protein
MQPVHFHCGHCGKLIAVNTEHLGRQVRCPHCQQVVFAPQSAAPTPEPAAGGVEAPSPGFLETILNVPAPTGDAEDIFSPADVSDDLFGGGEAPRIEMPPPDPLALTLPDHNAGALPHPEVTLPSTIPWMPPPVSDPAATAPAPFAPFGESASTEILPGRGLPAWMSSPITETLAPPPPEVPLTPPSETPSAITRRQGRTETKVPWFMLLVFSPLLLYSIFITIFSILLYRQEQEVERRLHHRRFEDMPDEGDKPGVQKGKRISFWKYDPKLPTLPLPEQLCTTLGKPLEIGDLEVTPQRVERKRLKVVVETSRPEPCIGDSLVLYLQMKNLSSEYSFAPLDNYFDRHWRGGAQPPFTLLEAGDKHRFHGGPADWYPQGDPNHRREWVEGRTNLPEALQPGEEKEQFVCTDGNDASAVAVLFGGTRPPYHGSFLWRVRVRRGLVRFQNKDHSATAVIGVRFTEKDITGAPRHVQ